MSKIVGHILLGTIGFLLLVIGILIPIIMPFSIILSLLILYWRIRVYNREKKKKENNIPEDIAQDFEYIQRRWVEDAGKTKPEEILWELARTKQRGITGEQITGRDKEITGRESTAAAEGRFDLQSNTNKGNSPGPSGNTENRKPRRKLVIRRRN